jgi:hypothetical protein
VLAAFSHQPVDSQTQVRIITDLRALEVASLTALAYELVLQTLNRLFTHTDVTEHQLGILIRWHWA